MFMNFTPECVNSADILFIEFNDDLEDISHFAEVNDASICDEEDYRTKDDDLSYSN